MPIKIIYDLTPLEAAAVEVRIPPAPVDAKGAPTKAKQTASEYLESLGAGQSQIDEIVTGYVNHQMLSYEPLGRALAIATQEQLAQIAPLIEQAQKILGLA